jgi:hypothetical protein
MVRLRMVDGKCRARMSAGTIEEDDDMLGQAVTNMALTSLKRLVGRQAVIKTGTSRDAIWPAGAYGVVNTVRLYVEHGQETFHAIHVEASSSFSLALRISLLAAALLAALVWILRLLVRRLIRVLAGLGGLIALSILLTILVGIILLVIPSP